MTARMTVLLLVVLCGGTGQAQRLTPLTAGMVIDHSLTIAPGSYFLSSSADLTKPAVTIRGNNIVVDFNGATLRGAAQGADPDTMAGVGIFVDGGSGVTVRNAVIRGYKVGILARRSSDLHLSHNDLSYNWKQRLYSGIEKESLVDWMSYHNNEKDEWLRYGAAMYLSQCDRAEIDNTTAVQGQNGLMVTSSNGLKVWNNTFQFLSAIGVGLYRVTGSTIMHNRIDWCVRGYSHGFYNRGQDSAGLLMYEQSSGNHVAFNSITHGGDGLFLWAGQSTMDTGQGGANDNEFYRNDFSYAVANGIEATFSRNRFIENRIEECWHGVWGGYSHASLWLRNQFARNTEGIAIEHGHNNAIISNTFDADEIAIRLWQNPTQDPDWGYPKYQDTKSHGYEIWGNVFRGNRTTLQITETADVRNEPPPGPRESLVPVAKPLPGGVDPIIKDEQRRGRDAIIVDEWGPYDWKSPKLWFRDSHSLSVLGPEGRWKVASARGVTVDPMQGKIGDFITIAPGAGPVVDYGIDLDYIGGSVTSPRGDVTPAGKPYRFRYSLFFAPIDWTVKLFEYTDAADPVKHPDAFQQLLTGAPLKTVTHDRLDYISGGSLEPGTPRDNVALVAEGTANLPPGDYAATVISDDGVRVWMDGELVLDDWMPHESRVDTVRMSGGARRFKVEYYEVGGFAELRFNIQRR